MMRIARLITTLVTVPAALLQAQVGWAQEEPVSRAASATESSEVSSSLYSTRLEAGLHTTRLGESVGPPAGGPGEGWGPGAGEKGLLVGRAAAGRVSPYAAYAYYGGTTSSRAVVPGSTVVTQSVASAFGPTQTLLRGQTNSAALTRPGAATAVGSGRAPPGAPAQGTPAQAPAPTSR